MSDVLKICEGCADSFQVPYKKREQRFCSHKCAFKITKGPEYNARIARASAKQRGDRQRGRGTGKSYPKLNGRYAHRVIAEQKLGRPLRSGEIVHHADENRLNYSPANLDVLPNQAEHARLHASGKPQSAEHVRKRVEATRRTKLAEGRDRIKASEELFDG